MDTPKNEARNSRLDAVAVGGAATLAAAAVTPVHAAGSDEIRIGLLGCGGRGSNAIRQNLNADPGVVVVALADLFPEKARKLRDALLKDPKYKDRIRVPDDAIFGGFDCHEKLVKTDTHLLLMATAPGFRPWQLMAAIQAGKHVFTEKPVASDVAGVRVFMEAARLAEKKGLAIVAGTQRRHEPNRIEIMKRIHDGAIGELVGGQCYWYGSGIWYRGAKPGMTEMEWQCENWYHFTWLSGDQICEQHIHNIDVMNWCFNGPPKKFTAVGGRACRDYGKQAKEVAKVLGNEAGWEKYNGDIWDHVYAEFEYANGARCLSLSGHSPGTSRMNEKIVGTKGVSDCNNRIADHKGGEIWKYAGPSINGMDQEHVDLIRSIRAGKPLNEGIRIAESTLTAIGARIAAKTGRSFSWDWLLKGSKEALMPDPSQWKAGAGLFHPIATGCDPLV